MKKYGKLLIVAIMAFFISVSPAFAKEIDLDRFAKIMEKENGSADYVYVIGKYVYTQSHTLTTQDVMLAARSIEVSDETITPEIEGTTFYKEMTIFQLQRDFSTGEWEIKKNYVGEGTLLKDGKFDIEYVDYNRLKDDKVLEPNEIVNGAMDKMNSDYYTATEVPGTNGGALEVTIADDKVSESFADGLGTGIYDALKAIVDGEKIESVEFSIDSGAYTVEVTKDTTLTDLLNWLKANSEDIFYKKYDELYNADFIGNEVTITVNLGESATHDYVTSDGKKSVEYTMTIDGKITEINVDNELKNAAEHLNNSDNNVTVEFGQEVHGVKNIVVTFKDTTKTVEEGMNSNVLDVIKEFIGKNGIARVYVQNDGEVTPWLDIRKDTPTSEIVKAIRLNGGFLFKGKDITKGEVTLADLVDVRLYFTVELESYAQTPDEDSTATYSILFAGDGQVVNAAELVEKTKDALESITTYDVEMYEGEIDVTYTEEQAAEKLMDVYYDNTTAKQEVKNAINALVGDSEDIASITINGKTFTKEQFKTAKEGLLSAKTDLAKEILSAIGINALVEDVTLGMFEGKDITFKINLVEGKVFDDPNFTGEYSVFFTKATE